MKINSVCILSKQISKEVVYTKIKKIVFMNLADSFTSYYDRGIRGRCGNVTKKWAKSLRK